MAPLLLQLPSLQISTFTSNYGCNLSPSCLVSAPPLGFNRKISRKRQKICSYRRTTASWSHNSVENVVKKNANFDGKVPEFDDDFSNYKFGFLNKKSIFAERKGIRHRRNLLVTASGNKEDENSMVQKEAEESLPIEKETFYKRRPFWFQVFVVILTLGFIDAGYSGDWSRIGVLSVEQEKLLKTAAFFVVPVSTGLIWKLSKK